jgi:hypothetical protein
MSAFFVSGRFISVSELAGRHPHRREKKDVLRAHHFTLDEQREMLEYVGCKVEHNRDDR